MHGHLRAEGEEGGARQALLGGRGEGGVGGKGGGGVMNSGKGGGAAGGVGPKLRGDRCEGGRV